MELAVSITLDARGTVPMGARLTDCVASVSSRTRPCLGLNPPKTPRAKIRAYGKIAPTMRAFLSAAPMLKSYDLAPIILPRMGGPECFQQCGIDETRNRHTEFLIGFQSVFEKLGVPDRLKASSRESFQPFHRLNCFPEL